MTLPQIQGVVKVWLTIAAAALGTALTQYKMEGHPLASWGDLWSAMPHVTFNAAIAAFFTYFARSPAAASYQAEKKTDSQ